MGIVVTLSGGRRVEINELQSEAFIREGLVAKLPDGRYKPINELAFLAALERVEYLVCDFCSINDVTWEFPCEDFDHAGLEGILSPYHSNGAWGACDACAGLIFRNQWSALSQRSVDTFIKRVPQLRPYKKRVRRHLADLHRQFVKHRNGPPKSVVQEEFFKIVTEGEVDKR